MTELKDSELEEKQREWIEYPQKKIEEIRQKAKEVGLDPEHIARGYIIENIIGDDGNAFGPTRLGSFNRENSILAWETISWRLNWEIDRPETPPEVKEQLGKILKKMQEIDWTTEEGFEEAYQLWREDAKNWLVNIRNTNPQLKKASEDYLILDGLIERK